MPLIGSLPHSLMKNGLSHFEYYATYSPMMGADFRGIMRAYRSPRMRVDAICHRRLFPRYIIF